MEAKALLARARQGDPSAIASLMNRNLAARGMKAWVKADAGHYKFLIEADEVPPQAATVNWIGQGIARLAIAQLQSVAVYGKARSHPHPDWQGTLIFSHAVNTQPALATDQSEDDFVRACSSTIKSESTLNLTEYCFVQNKALLTQKMSPPAAPVVDLILSFSALHPGQKMAIVFHLNRLFREPAAIKDDSLSRDGQAWIKAMNALDDKARCCLSIWLSRYCSQPAKTVEMLKPQAA